MFVKLKSARNTINSFPLARNIGESFFLNNPLSHLCRDNTPSILLCEWEVESDYLEDDRITGVMPVLFANDPKAAEEGMMDNIATARKDLDKINWAFFVPESLDIEEAAKVAKKPRLGDAEFLFKDWNLERLFETSVPTSAYTGEWCL